MTHPESPEYDPIKAAWNTVATYSTYGEAQSAVNQLCGDGFSIENLDIVGSDLRMVERVTGRMTKARAAANIAVRGAGVGLFFGLLLGLFSAGFAWLGLVVLGALIGAIWGAAFGLAAQMSTRGQRDFISTRNLAAERYNIIARAGHAEQARFLLESAGRLRAR